MRRLFSLEGKLTALTVALVVLAVLFSFVLAEYTSLWVGVPLALLIVVSGTLVATRAFVRPISRLLSALIDSTQNFKDKDFSIRIASHRRDELGELVDSHNEVGDLIRDER
ncbi:MAG: HAMP domain-containing protein, partial [Pseudomonadales bacterium]|nr:HAMP domain-containing protein [Pseudomonadales bacterium]